MEAYKLLSTVFLVVMTIFEMSGGVRGQEIQNIFILAGQSNMVGRGGAIKNFVWDGKVPEECNPSPQILRLNVNRTWEMAREPLHRDIDVGKHNGVGPGMPFANFLLKNNSSFGSIGLVPCAIGDTSISEWSKGANGSELYNTMLARTQAALMLSGGGTLKGILWYQGEKDITDERAPLYKGRFQQFIKDARSDLQSPSLPFIEVALNVGPGNLTDTVRAAQFETAAEVVNVKCVDARGLPKEEDRVHLTTDSQVKLGTMMAIAFLDIIHNKSSPT